MPLNDLQNYHPFLNSNRISNFPFIAIVNVVIVVGIIIVVAIDSNGIMVLMIKEMQIYKLSQLVIKVFQSTNNS